MATYIHGCPQEFLQGGKTIPLPFLPFHPCLPWSFRPTASPLNATEGPTGLGQHCKLSQGGGVWAEPQLQCIYVYF